MSSVPLSSRARPPETALKPLRTVSAHDMLRYVSPGPPSHASSCLRHYVGGMCPALRPRGSAHVIRPTLSGAPPALNPSLRRETERFDEIIDVSRYVKLRGAASCDWRRSCSWQSWQVAATYLL